MKSEAWLEAAEKVLLLADRLGADAYSQNKEFLTAESYSVSGDAMREMIAALSEKESIEEEERAQECRVKDVTEQTSPWRDYSWHDYIGRTVHPITRILYPVSLAPSGTYERWEERVPRRVVMPTPGKYQEIDRLWAAGIRMIPVEWPGMIGYRLVAIEQIEVTP